MTETNINCVDGEVKVHDSYFNISIKHPYKISLCKEMLHLKSRCHNAAGTKDCGVYAIAFASAIAFGKNPGMQNLKQDEMRAHLVVCFNKHSVSIFPCK